MAGVGGVFTSQSNIYDGAFSQKQLTAIFEKILPPEMFKWLLSTLLGMTHTHTHTHTCTYTHTHTKRNGDPSFPLWFVRKKK